MRFKQPRWQVLVGMAVLTLLGAALLLPQVPKPKARALGVSAVNSVAPPSLTLAGPSR